jgi:predicted GTPase
MNKKIFFKNNLILITNKKETEIRYILDDIRKAKIYNLINLSKDSPIIPFSTKGDEHKVFDIIKKLIENKQIDEIIYIDSDLTKEEKFEIWELTRIF